ncbi:ABC transporter permease [Natronorubrum texcoconense]|uniref:ABC-2 type transport system permease protein n=1 Tax=Natronorubrum texcoconense TaxID=1095776 RepID=A0A1G8WRR2_9EURY|nr:ABC transporter permease [Natronorubrum texcoconense]SDJ80813.1 ABC-2 type transport system permease protein [Natronorubrum texcoconense]
MSEQTANTKRGGVITLTRAIFMREVTLFLRYPVEVAGQLVGFLVMFGIIVLGGQMIVGDGFSESLEAIIVGYFLWIMSLTAYSNIANEIGMEASWGTLERLALTPFGFGVIMLVKSIAKLIIAFLTAFLILLIMLVTTRTTLSIDLVTIIPILVFTIASVFGIGFAVGGFTVLYKNIQSWVMLLQFGFIGLISAPAFEIMLLEFLPLAKGSEMIQTAMRNGTRLWEFSLTDVTVLVAVGVGYLVVGYGIFELCQRRARKLGVLGHY